MDIPQVDESIIRASIFLGVLVLMSSWEAVRPRRQRVQKRARRWITNLLLVGVDNLALRLIVPLLAVGIAGVVNENGWGLLGVIDAPVWLEVAAAIVLLDLAVYGQHVATHKVPALWALHKVHHADRDIDASTGVRFHPIEIVLSMLYKMAVVAVLGAPVLSVVIFETALNASAMFNHANVRLPQGVDRFLRASVVTPDMHRVHHSVIRSETDSNYGFCLSVWDRFFGTYQDQPSLGHEKMEIGLLEYQTNDPSTFRWNLLAPFDKLGRVGSPGSLVVAMVLVAALLGVGVGAFALSLRLADVEAWLQKKYDSVAHIEPSALSDWDSQTLVIFDVRERKEYEVSRIDGSINVDPDLSASEFVDKYKAYIPNRKLIFYCSVGQRSSSFASRVKMEAIRAGADQVINLKGGLFRWHNEGCLTLVCGQKALIEKFAEACFAERLEITA